MNGPACPTAQQYNRHNGFSPSYVPLALCEQGDKGAGLHPCSGFLRPTSGADTGTGPLHFPGCHALTRNRHASPTEQQPDIACQEYSIRKMMLKSLIHVTTGSPFFGHRLIHRIIFHPNTFLCYNTKIRINTYTIPNK